MFEISHDTIPARITDGSDNSGACAILLMLGFRRFSLSVTVAPVLLIHEIRRKLPTYRYRRTRIRIRSLTILSGVFCS